MRMVLDDRATKDSAVGRAQSFVLIREIAASGLAAAIAGLIAGGVGGRLVMRVSALLNPSLRGIVSENGNRVGDVTAAGSIELVLFGGLLTGVVAATAWVFVRPWLPRRRSSRLWAAAVVAVGLTGFHVVDSENFDFSILKPSWVHVLMFTLIVAVAGFLTAWIDLRLVGRLRQSVPFTPFAVVIIVMGALMLPVSLGSFFMGDFCFCSNPPRLTGFLLVVAGLATAVSYVARFRGVALPIWLGHIGRGATAAAVLAGMIYLGGQVADIV